MRARFVTPLLSVVLSLGLSVGLSLGLAACGGGAGADNVGGFVGTWMFTGGTESLSCGGNVFQSQQSGTVTIAEGTGADLVVTADGCTLSFDVTKGSAALRPGQSCTSVTGTSSLRIDFTALTLTLTDGDNLSESGNANATVTDSGQTLVCTMTDTATLHRVSH
jgi:hypothetical protein